MTKLADNDTLMQPLPASTDVVVIGGGLAGAALAYYLAREGVEVALVERADLNREASGTNAGSFHFQIALHQLTAWETDNVRDRLFAEVQLHAEAAAMWSTLEAELDAAMDVHITGGLMVAETPLELQILIDKQKIEQEAGLETHLLLGPELHAFAPYLADDLAGAVWCPDEGHANPLLAAPLFALRAGERGALVRTQAAVTAIESHPDGGAHRFTVTTSRGHIAAHRVVNAAGAWANDIAELTGLRFPIRADGLHLNVTEPREKVLEPMVQHIGRRLTLKQSTNNTFIIGGGWPAQPQPAPRALLDAVGERRRQHGRGRARDAEPRRRQGRAHLVGRHGVHGRPLADRRRDSRLPGYHALIATTGFTLGPLMARLLAEHMASPDPRPLPPAFSPDRVQYTTTPEGHAMDRNDVSWHGYWPACPTPFHADQSLDLDSFRALLEFYIGEGVHGLLVNGTTGEWFSQTPDERRQVVETAIDQAAGRVPVVAGCTSLHRARGDRARPSCARGRRRRHQLDAAALQQDVPRRDRRVLLGHLRRHRRADPRLQLAARLQRRDRSRPRQPDRRHRERRRDQGQHAERAAVLRDGADRRRPDPRLRPVHVERGVRAAARPRRRRVHRGRHAVRGSRRGVLGGVLAR